MFAVMERLTAELFATYVRRSGDVEPYFTEYCDGKLVSCPGMKQWGTVDRANEGMDALQILRYYYGSRVQLVSSSNIAAIPVSWPGVTLRRGDTGSHVEQVQFWLSELAQFDSALPGLAVDGVFGAATERAVRQFQQDRGLTADGLVGQATWEALYAAWVEIQSDLGGTAWPGVTLRRGDTGMEVRLVQFWLQQAAANYSALAAVAVDGSFGPATEGAVTAFQSLFGLTADGLVGRATWNKLNEVALAVANEILEPDQRPGQFPGTVRQGSRGTPVRAVQYYLRRLAAYYSDLPTVTVDGIFGAATARAVQAWQDRAGLTVDGVVGRLTWDSLYAAALALQTSGPVVRVAEAVLPAGTLGRGDQGPAVLRLSQLLLFLACWLPEINFLGPAASSADFTAGLEVAVRSAQRLFGLPQTGTVAAGDWAAFAGAARQLAAVNPAAAAPEPEGIWPASGLALGSAGPAVGQLQRWLNAAAAADQDFLFVPETGALDQATRDALANYQLARSLPTLGVVDAATWESLRRYAQDLCQTCKEG